MSNLLWLIWQNKESRYKYHVGNLYYKSNGYYFEYNKDGHSRNVFEAMDNGFLPLANFPTLGKAYYSPTLFPAFTKRLPNKRRPDYNELLEKFGVDTKASDMELLRITKGKTNMDSMELIMPITVDPSGSFNLTFHIEGWRYYNGSKVWSDLEKDQTVHLILEPYNEHDDFAVSIHSKSGEKLGYAPAVYSEFITKNINRLNQSKILKKQETAIPEMKVMIHLQGVVEQSSVNYTNMSPVEEHLVK
ncbi:HIRAN domain-containing protein [Alkalicoccobacillus porphyridii]|uniref:DNA-binding protein n=1 Tax=Alkalicoccobacillus porphyridii TaxID=2597270 RepID=A0A554A1W9_9BACI|nr:HIRAN domain-containing protein [Alkalicoccobacillus porphyridii]TSB47690.1 DNA-binding protein [Alkalicoccobacillus porphyridii]